MLHLLTANCRNNCVVTLEYSDLVQKHLLNGFLFEVRHIYLFRLER